MRRTRAMFTIRDISSLFRLWPMRDSPFCTRQFEVTYTSALSKYPELAIAYAGRAQCSLWKGQFKDATEDISRAIDINNNDPLYRDYFHALLYRCLQGTANMLKHKAHANEAMWSDVQKGKELAFHELERIVDRNSDWAARITLAECLLETNPERALTLLDAAWSDIEKELDVRSQCHEVLLNPESTEEIKLFVKSWFSQVDYSCNQNENSFQSATMKTAFKTLLNDLNQSVSLKDFAAKMKLEKLTTQELDAVLRVCAMVHVGELGFARPVECHVFPTKLWDGTAALVLRERMEQFSGNVTLKNQEKLNRLLGKIQSLDSEADSYNSKAAVELVKGMGKEKQSDLLATLFKDVGEPHSSAITKCDADFFELLKDIDQTYSTIPLGIPGSKVYLSEQKKLAMDFLWQQKDRIALAKAKCHIALKNDDLALELLSKIIKRNSYFSMFQVLEARAQLTKNMGHVELSDSDFKELSRLRVSSTDIPNFDNNRKIDNEF